MYLPGHWLASSLVQHALTVEQQLEEFKGCGVSADISQVTNTTASDGDAGTITIVFIGSHFTHYHGVADLLTFVRGDGMSQ